MTAVILDGSNLSLWGQREKRHIKTLGALLPCMRALVDCSIDAYVIFDASFRYRIDKNSSAAADFETLLHEDENFQIAPAGTPADTFILEFAALRGFGVISNDTFRDFLKRQGKQGLTFQGKPVQVHSFQMLMGGFVIPSLRIRYLIDEQQLAVSELLDARKNGAVRRTGRAGEAPPASPRSGGSGKGAKAQPPAPPAKVPNRDAAKSEPVSAAPMAKPRRTPGEIDALIELSPLMLRAGDVFEAYRKVTGKAWKSRNSSKTAEAFAEECFGRPVHYRDVEGRKKNDGYFFDASCSEARHDSIRDYVTSKSPKIVPLIASARTRLVPVLDLIHDDALAGGFTVDQLCARADALNIPYYDRYLRAALYALIAVNGVLGENERQTDISNILKGRMRVNPDESSSDRLNFLQRGILYLLSDQDNVLPDQVVSEMGWMLQLPLKPKIHDAIVRGHLEWLAQIEG